MQEQKEERERARVADEAGHQQRALDAESQLVREVNRQQMREKEQEILDVREENEQVTPCTRTSKLETRNSRS